MVVHIVMVSMVLHIVIARFSIPGMSVIPGISVVEVVVTSRFAMVIVVHMASMPKVVRSRAWSKVLFMR